MNYCRVFHSSECGSTFTEYMVIFACLLIALLTALTSFGEGGRENFCDASIAVSGSDPRDLNGNGYADDGDRSEHYNQSRASSGDTGNGPAAAYEAKDGDLKESSKNAHDYNCDGKKDELDDRLMDEWQGAPSNSGDNLLDYSVLSVGGGG